jgi:hypothetical protein
MLTVMFAVTAAVTLVIATFMLYRLRALRPDPAVAAYARFCAQLARRGVDRHPSEGPTAFSRRAAAAHPELAIGIAAISELYVRLRYGRQAGATDVAELQRAVAAFRAHA